MAPEAAVAPAAPATPATTPAAAPAPAAAPVAAPAAAPAAAAPPAPAAPAKTGILGPEPEAPKTPAATGAPEKYADFKLPEGMTLNKSAMEKFAPIFKEAGLSQDTAQKFVDAQASFEQTVYKEQVKALETREAEWVGSLKAEWGNDFDKNAAIARKGIGELGGPDLMKFLDSIGATNAPQLVKAFFKRGLEVQEAQPGDGRPDGGGKEKSLGDSLYPSMKSKPSGNYRAE